ncbi:MAG: hypothetical protein Q9163_000459 [Psora crenata]
MAQLAFPDLTKSTKTPNGTTYSYVHVPAKDDKPYLLLLHGFPSSSYDWRHQISYFRERGYGLIVPDLLGYGGTDKPKEIEAYRMKKMSEEVIGILDAEGVKEGSVLLSRLANYYPSRFTKLCWMGVGYSPPTSEEFSIDATNELAKQTLGYPVIGYWHFFNSSDAEELMNQNNEAYWEADAFFAIQHESSDSLVYARDPNWFKENLCYPGATRSYYVEKKTGPLGDWISKEEIAMHDRIMAVQNGGYGPPLNWYKCAIANVDMPDNAEILEEQKHIKQPTLLIGPKYDYLFVPNVVLGQMKPFVNDLKVVEVESGHWNALEKAEETNKALEEFVEGK